MNKEQLLEKYESFVDKLNIVSEYFVVGGGGAMVLHGLRAETADIDVAVRQDVFDKIINAVRTGIITEPAVFLFGIEGLYPNERDCSGVHDSGKPVIQVDGFEIHLDELDSQLVDGAGCQRIEDILRMKLLFNRPKDQADIALLQAALT